MNLPKEESMLRPGRPKYIYPELKDEIEVDVAVVGGGKTGIETAYQLTEAGLKVVVLEQYDIGAGTTGHTTGKVTSQHNLVYSDLIKRLGNKTAKIYAEANESAVKIIDEIIKKEKIETGWQRADNFVFTAEIDQVKRFRDEAKAAASLGLPASFETNLDLPFKVTAAVKFTNQAHFSAQKYIDGLAKVIKKRGGHIFENSKAVGFEDGTTAAVRTANGKVRAKSVVVATQVPTKPLLARFSYCLYEYPEMSYIVAGKPTFKFKGMYISPDKDHYSLLPVGETLLIGGQNHIPAPLTSLRANARYKKLAEYGKKFFGIEKLDYRWKARDYLCYDNVPIVGKLYSGSKNIYVATGFKKWGMTNTTIAAIILRDQILGLENKWADIYRPGRSSLIKSIPHAIRN